MNPEDILRQGERIKEAIKKDPSKDGSEAIVLPLTKLLVGIALDLNSIATSLKGIEMNTRKGEGK